MNTRFVESKYSYYGWKVVASAFAANVIAYGLVYTYSVFFLPLSSEFGWSRSVTSGAFGFYGIFHNILAFFAGKLCDQFGPKPTLIIGGFCLGLSMILMGYVNSVWELYLYFGVFVSIGVGFTYAPVISTVSRWFTVKRGLAIGITAAGLGTGSFIFYPLSAWLISSFGWRRAYTVMGIIAWGVFIPIVKYMKQSSRESLENKEVDGLSFSEALWTSTFWAYAFSWLLICIAMWATIVHIVPLAIDKGMTPMAAGMLAGIIGVTSIIGRISSGYFADKVGGKRVLTMEFIIQLLAFIWLFFSSEVWMLIVFVLIFGLSSGGWAGVIAAFPADYFGFKATGEILGLACIFAGVGVSMGSFMGGYIFDITHSYNYMVVMCIIATILALVSSLFIVPVIKPRAGR